jgi:hypothetical protein
MNYIKHLNAFFSIIKNDSSLNPNHVSLYLALFQYWNYNRFQNPFPVYRDNIMQLSKIGSRNTYHKCMKELHQSRYIVYHPAPSKFLQVKITVTRLDTYLDKLQPHQLDIFSSSPSPVGEGFRVRSSPNTDTVNGPHVSHTSPDIDTDTVPHLGQNIKPNISKQRETPTPTFNQQRSVKRKEETGADLSTGYNLPSALAEVKEYFQQKGYATSEANKFYNHYKSLGWKIQGKAPIEDWKALVEKWMENAKHWPGQQQQQIQEKDIGKEIQYLYESWKEGKNIIHQLSQNHFEYLQLQLTDEIKTIAKAERIKQLSSSNQYSDQQLLQAYNSKQQNNESISKDTSNIDLLAKRIAILSHFKKIQQNEH